LGSDPWRERSFTISNTAEATATLSGSPFVAVTGPQASEFTVMTQPAATISGGAAQTFTVRFQPLSSGAHRAQIVIFNDTDQSPYDFAVGGATTP
jgi:hypothetical protein